MVLYKLAIVCRVCTVRGQLSLTNVADIALIADHLHPFMHARFPGNNRMFQQDNAPPTSSTDDKFDSSAHQIEKKKKKN